MNVHDSEKIAGILSELGYDQSNDLKDADVVILNTCSIRQKAEHKFYSELGRIEKIKKNNPDLRIAVAGCIAQQKGNTLFKRFPYVDFIFGPQNIDNLGKWINNKSQKSEVRSQKSDNRIQTTALENNPGFYLKYLPAKRVGRVKAWVSIMFGCDNFCAYCVVPYTRGREKSRPCQDIVNEVRNLAEEGFKEITLLGQNVNSYGKNLNETNMSERDAKNNKNIDFPDLLKVLHKVKGIERIRFVSSHPRDLSVKLIETMRDLPKVCEHIHLPIQSGSDRILSLMNRDYTYSNYKEKVEMLRDTIQDIAITTDIIVGFPGEKDEDFQCTINALKEIEFDGIYAFKYSKRPDTKALDLPNHVDEKTKSERLSGVLDLQGLITFKKNKALEGEILEVLVEGVSETDKDKLTGRARTNKIVNSCGDRNSIGKLVQIKISEAKQHSLYGERVQGFEDSN